VFSASDKFLSNAICAAERGGVGKAVRVLMVGFTRLPKARAPVDGKGGDTEVPAK
jgi:hypothetical protein